MNTVTFEDTELQNLALGRFGNIDCTSDKNQGTSNAVPYINRNSSVRAMSSDLDEHSKAMQSWNLLNKQEMKRKS